jgi:hypothetical protein
MGLFLPISAKIYLKIGKMIFFLEEVVMKAIRISEYMPEKDLEKVLN